MPSIFLSPSTQEGNLYVTGNSEAYWMNRLADAMEPYLTASGIRYTRNSPTGSAAQSIRQSNSGNYDLHLALHSNAAPPSIYGQVQGSDVYYYPSSMQGKKAADLIAQALQTIYPEPGKVRALGTTAIGEVRQTKAPSVFIELAYHDNVADANWITENLDLIAKTIVQALTEYFGIPFREPNEAFPRTGTVTLSDKKGAGNNVHFSGATGDLKNLVTSAGAEGTSSFTLSPTETVVKEGTSKAEHLFGKSFTVTLNGQTKTFTLGDPKTDAVPQNNEDIKKLLEKELDNAFGKDKINVTLVPDADGKESFSFSVSNGDTFRITSPVGEVLGLGENGVTSYVDTGKTLGDLLGKDLGGSDGWAKGVGQPHEVKDADGNISYVDNEGNAVDKDNYRLDKDGKRFKELTINGVTIGQYNEDTALETVLNDINSNTEAGVSVSFSKTTNQFVFTAKETGEGGRIDIGAGLGETLFGPIDYKDDGSTILGDTQKSSYTAGKDAIFHATINGKNMALSRSSNTFDLDGMSITLNGTFNKGSATDTPILSSQLKGLDPDKDTTIFDLNGDDVTFSSKTDTDKIIDVVKTMVEDYNAIVSEVKKAYSDMPLEKSNGSRYKPLTDEDKADMTESEIKAYEEKAKTGILFMDRDLSSLYSALRSAVAPGGSDGSFLRSIGIKTSYEDGLTTLSLDENALREALEQNPDQVKDAFTKSKENGAASDGLMASIQKVTDRYAATTGATKGILIEKAGSKYSPSAALNNTLLEQMKDIDKQVDKWQAKMSDKVDYYTNKFTQLEMLIAQMNSQSSSLAGMMGGY